MPFRRRTTFRKKRRNPRRKYFRARRIGRTLTRKMIPNTLHTKFSAQPINCATAAAGNLLSGALSLYDPGRPGRDAGSGTAIASCVEWATYQGLFDMYKVNYFKARFVPLAPYDPSTTAYNSIYYAYDPDNAIAVVPPTLPGAYVNYKQRLLYKPFKIVTKPRKIMLYQTNDTGPTVTYKAGWMNITAEPRNGVVFYYSSGNTANKVYYQVTVTYYVTLRTRV